MNSNNRRLELLRQLPPIFTHEIEEFETPNKNSSLTTIIRCNCSNEIDFDRWKREYEGLSSTNWNVRKTYQSDGRYLTYRKDYVCRLASFQHVEQPRGKRRSIERNCNASMVFKVKNDSESSRRRDPYLRLGLCGVVEMKSAHNHPLENLRSTEEVLREAPANSERRLSSKKRRVDPPATRIENAAISLPSPNNLDTESANGSTQDQADDHSLAKTLTDELSKALTKFSTDQNVRAAARLFLSRLHQCSTASQFSAFLRSVGSSLDSISRRAIENSGSTARLGVGGSLDGRLKSSKRKVASALDI